MGAKPNVNITDWSFPANDNTRIYSVSNTGSLIYISTTDLSVNTIVAAGTVPAQSYGATYFDLSGNLYAKGNTSGVIFKFVNATSATPGVVTFSTSSASAQNDGAWCAVDAAPVIGDYGDGPNSYGTNTSSGGPCHLLLSPDTTLAKVYFGLGVSTDGDGDPGVGANKDIDDGASFYTPVYGGVTPLSIASYKVAINVHNTSASVANVSAWIDWNTNGLFDAGERQFGAFQ